MATIITETVKPSGGDYTLLSLAVAAVSSNLVSADEQWNIEVSSFSGGLADSVSMPAITSDATRYLEIRAAAGDEYLPHLDTGIFLTANVAFSGVFVNSGTHFLRLIDIGFKNTRTLASGRCVDWFGDDGTIERVYGTTASTSGAIVFFFNNGARLTVRETLSYLGTTGFDFGNNDPRTADKLTSIDASAVGIDTGTADTTITNSFSFGSANPWLGTFNASSSNNASDGTDAPGGSSLQNRTSADFANFAGNDFRTASGSALATGGSVDFIGYALEVSAGNTTGTITQDTSAFTQLANGTVILDITGSVTQSLGSFTQSATGTVTSAGFTGTITQTTESFTQSAIGTVVLNTTGTITQSASSFTQLANGTVSIAFTGTITQTSGSFTQSALGVVAIDITGAINQTVSSFTQSATGVVPLNIPVSDGLLGNQSTGNGIVSNATFGSGLTGKGSL